MARGCSSRPTHCRLQHRGLEPQADFVALTQPWTRCRHQSAAAVVQGKRQAVHIGQLTDSVGEHQCQAVLAHLSAHSLQHVAQASLQCRLLSQQPLGIVGPLRIRTISVRHKACGQQRTDDHSHHPQKNSKPQAHGTKLTTKHAKKERGLAGVSRPKPQNPPRSRVSPS